MVKLLKERHQRDKERFHQQTCTMLGDEFVQTYTLDFAENNDLFLEMHQLNYS